MLSASTLRPPLHPPRSTPKERFQFPQNGEGNAAFAAGASLPRCARSGDLPPRRANAIVSIRSGRNPLQPSTADTFVQKDISSPRPFRLLPIFLALGKIRKKQVCEMRLTSAACAQNSDLFFLSLPFLSFCLSAVVIKGGQWTCLPSPLSKLQFHQSNILRCQKFLWLSAVVIKSGLWSYLP